MAIKKARDISLSENVELSLTGTAITGTVKKDGLKENSEVKFTLKHLKGA